MKALSVQPFYATLIATGMKSLELRTWKTNYRGWILICSSKAINKMEREEMVSGHAISDFYTDKELIAFTKELTKTIGNERTKTG